MMLAGESWEGKENARKSLLVLFIFGVKMALGALESGKA